MTDEQQCEATHKSPTAVGEVEVRCVKPRGHEGRHEAWIKVFPIRWANDAVVHYNPGWVEQVTACGEEFIGDLPRGAVSGVPAEVTCPACRMADATFDEDRL